MDLLIFGLLLAKLVFNLQIMLFIEDLQHKTVLTEFIFSAKLLCGFCLVCFFVQVSTLESNQMM